MRMKCKMCSMEIAEDQKCCADGMNCSTCSPECKDKMGDDGKCTCGCMN